MMITTASRKLVVAMSIAILSASASAAECSSNPFIAQVLQQSDCGSRRAAPSATAAHDVADGLAAPERFIEQVLERNAPAPPRSELLVEMVQNPSDNTARAEDYFRNHVLSATAPTR